MKLEELNVYQMSMEIGEEVWKIVKLNNYINSIGKKPYEKD